MTDQERQALEAGTGKDYVKARDAALSKHRAVLAADPAVPSKAIPYLKAAWVIRAKEPEKAARFTGALTGENKEFLDPRLLNRSANKDQIAEYLGGYPADFLPLAEEYLYKYHFAYAASSILGLATWYLAKFPDRGRTVAAKSFHDHASSPQAQFFLIGMLEILGLKSSSPDLWQAYRTTTHIPLKHFAQFLLAKFGDADMKRELERLLSDDKTAPADREAAVEAYGNFFPGTPFDKNVEIYKAFKQPQTRLTAAKGIDPTNEAQAKVTRGLIQGTTEKESLPAKQELEANLKELTD